MRSGASEETSLGATATFSEATLQVEPGGEASLMITVRNTGTVVDQFTLEVLGDAGEWATVTPESLSLFPDAEGQATVTFRPPRRAELSAGEIPFAVKVTSHEDPTGSIVEEGSIAVGVFADVFAELLPRTAHGRTRAHFDLAVDNRGNERVNATLSAIEPDERLRFEFEPAAVVAEPDTAAFSRVVARPAKTFWRGNPVTIPFKVVVEPAGGTPLLVDGTMLQEARLPKWFWKAVLAAIALILLLVLLWFTVLKPTVQSAAKDAVQEPLAQTQQAVNDLAKQVGATAPKVGTSTSQAPGTQPGAGSLAGDLGVPIDRRLAVNGGGTTSDKFTVPGDQVVSLTDVVFQNPNGETGDAQLMRGDTVLIHVNLANFRDLDYHFVSPIVIGKGQTAELQVKCASPTCTTAAYLTGFEKKAP